MPSRALATGRSEGLARFGWKARMKIAKMSLHDEDAQRQAAGERVEFGLVVKQLHDDRGAGEAAEQSQVEGRLLRRRRRRSPGAGTAPLPVRRRWETGQNRRAECAGRRQGSPSGSSRGR